MEEDVKTTMAARKLRKVKKRRQQAAATPVSEQPPQTAAEQAPVETDQETAVPTPDAPESAESNASEPLVFSTEALKGSWAIKNTHSPSFLPKPENEPTDEELALVAAQTAQSTNAGAWLSELHDHLRSVYDYGMLTVREFARVNNLLDDCAKARQNLDWYVQQGYLTSRWYQSKARYEITDLGKTRLQELAAAKKKAKTKS